MPLSWLDVAVVLAVAIELLFGLRLGLVFGLVALAELALLVLGAFWGLPWAASGLAPRLGVPPVALLIGLEVLVLAVLRLAGAWARVLVATRLATLGPAWRRADHALGLAPGLVRAAVSAG